MLRFRVLGASFSRFGCFVLRSSFSSASFSKLPIRNKVLIHEKFDSPVLSLTFSSPVVGASFNIEITLSTS